jgi:integrase
VGTNVGPRRHPVNKLTAVSVRALKRPGRYADGGGLYLRIKPSGRKVWVWRGTVQGRRRDIGLGSVQTVSLADARERARLARAAARLGHDPRPEPPTPRPVVPTFHEAAVSVHESHAAGFTNPKHKAQWIASLERYAVPVIGSRPISDVTAGDVLRVVEPIWIGKRETASRVLQRIRTILDWAKAHGYRPDNPADDLEQVLPRVRKTVRHMPALPWVDLPACIVSVQGANANDTTRAALEFLVLTASRTGEVRGAQWSEIDLATATWAIPANRMKAHKEHRVPLSARAVAILRAQRASAGTSPYVFPGRSGARPLSNMSMAKLLARLGYAPDVATVHGMRSTFRDWAADCTNFPRSVVEACLAHVVENKVEAAYYRSDVFKKRRALMTKWATHCLSATRGSDKKA